MSHSLQAQAWIWQQGGPYFGVATYLRGRPGQSEPVVVAYWSLVVIFYGVSAAGNLLLTIPQPRLTIAADAIGDLWKVSDITGVCALVSIFLMGAFALIAAVRLPKEDQGA